MMVAIHTEIERVLSNTGGLDALIASPHPLDFDWRFDNSTIAKVCKHIRGQNVLALGAPSIARRIEASGGQVLLVDRQPVQDVCNQLVADVPTLDAVV